MTVEDREVGNVDREVYKKWAVAGGGLIVGVYIGEFMTNSYGVIAYIVLCIDCFYL